MSDASRRLFELTRAFVDRTPIDWTAILARTSSHADREIMANLWLLDRLRHSRSASPPPHHTVSASWLTIRALATLAAMQTICAVIIALVAAMNGVPIVRVSPLVLGVAFAGASVIVGAVAGRDPRRLWLAVMFGGVASAFARACLDGLPAQWTVPADPLLRGLYPEAFAPACLWHFSQDFPRGQRFATFDVIVRRSTSAAWIVGLLLFGTNLVSERGGIELGPATHMMRNHPGHLFWHLFTMTLIPPVLAILVRSRRAPAPERRRISRLALTIAAGTSPFLAVGCIRSVLPGAEEWFAAASAQDRIWVDRAVMTALLAMPILAAAALIADRPFGSMRVSRGIARRRLRSVLMRCVPRRAAGMHGRLARAVDRLRLARSDREVLAILEDEVRDGMSPHRVQVLRPLAGDDFSAGARSASRLSRDSALLRLLRAIDEPVDLSTDGPVLALLPDAERLAAIAGGRELAAGVKVRDGTIRAIVVCSRGAGAVRSNRRDRWFLTMLVTAAGAALDAHRVVRDRDSIENRIVSGRDVAFECRRCGRVCERIRRDRCCGTPLTLAAVPRHLAGKFVVRRRLGAGGMGVVYLARDRALDRDVALKTLPALYPRAVKRLRAEARAMARLNHESLAVLYGLEVWRDTPVLVVEYLARGTLAERLRRGPLPSSEVARLGSALAAALAYMHGQHVVHCDLKPGNVGFTASGAVKLLDFGLATMIARSAADHGKPSDHAEIVDGASGCQGTVGYLPPEARLGCRPAPAFDLWALSVVLLESITGVNPFASLGGRGAIGRLRQPDLAALLSGLAKMPTPMRAFFERALALDPDRRFETAAEFRRALATAFPTSTGLADPRAN